MQVKALRSGLRLGVVAGWSMMLVLAIGCGAQQSAKSPEKPVPATVVLVGGPTAAEPHRDYPPDSDCPSTEADITDLIAELKQIAEGTRKQSERISVLDSCIRDEVVVKLGLQARPQGSGKILQASKPQRDSIGGDGGGSGLAQGKRGGDVGDREGDNTEAYDHITDNPFFAALQQPLSTFSIDVDTASYSNVRRMLFAGQLPPKDAVRIEELLNYFSYDDPPPADDKPFSVRVETAECPWKRDHRLVRVGLKGREIPLDKRPPATLVFLIDVSGSMSDENKLPLVKRGLRLLVDQLAPRDAVAIVVYAGSQGLALPPTPCTDTRPILDAIDKLEAGGSTNGSAGIELAYQIAQEHFVKGGNNRVILCTDGDFNVGVTDDGSLTRLIEEKAKSGVFLTVLGFGYGNLKDSKMEKLADKGNGNYAYIDSLGEARKVLVEQMAGTLLTIAKDVKFQVEFNPGRVAGYRLIGYENRLLAAQDFNDDGKDAGEIGSGHSVTALYEIVPAGKEVKVPGVDPLKYQRPGQPTDSPELLTVKLRYKAPDGDSSQLIELPVTDNGRSFDRASDELRWSAAVAAFGMLLRDSPHKGTSSYNEVLEIATGVKANGDAHRAEFRALVETARDLSKK